jgi:1-phosphofructokinase family hexose kinase
MIACIAPSPSIDRLFEVERLRPGEVHRPTRFVRVAGGKGLNAARAAAALGADVRAVALLGGPSGRWIADELHRIGVPLVASACAGETRSCLSVADRGSGSLTEFYEQSAPVSPEEWEAFARVVEDAAASADWTTVSGSLPPGAPADACERFAAAGANVAVDTVALGAARPSLVKVNATEAATLTGLPVRGAGETMEAAHLLRRRIGGDGHGAAVTSGRDGAVLVTPDGSAWRGSLPAAGAYPVGSGDAFLAGLVTALAGGADWADALATALGAAAANAEVPGAGLLDPDRARALAEQAVVEPAAAVKAR